MKHFTSMFVVFAFLLCTTLAHAGFGLPKTVDKVVDKGAKTGLEASINDKLKKKNCAFKDSVTENEVTCDLNQIVSDLNAWRQGLEGTIANDVNIHLTASANNSNLSYKRGQYTRDVIRGQISYWDYYVERTTANGDKLDIRVDIR